MHNWSSIALCSPPSLFTGLQKGESEVVERIEDVGSFLPLLQKKTRGRRTPHQARCPASGQTVCQA